GGGDGKGRGTAPLEGQPGAASPVHRGNAHRSPHSSIEFAPDMAAESNHKPALLEVAAALREVHRALVAATRGAYEREVGPAGGPGHMLRLLTEAPFFAWLHPM